MQFNVDEKNTRLDIYSAFLKPLICQSNLELITEAQATKINFKTYNSAPKVSSIEFVKHGKTYLVEIKEELILCCGAIHSPHLLQLSGIGDAELLAKHGIPVVRDLPAVGENLQDHLICFSKYELKVPLPKEHANLIDVNLFVKDPSDGRYYLQMYNIIFPRTTLGIKGGTFCAESIVNCPESTGNVRIQSSNPFDRPLVDLNFLESKKGL